LLNKLQVNNDDNMATMWPCGLRVLVTAVNI